MTLAERLGYDQTSPNALQRTFRRFASSRPGAWMFSKTARYIDRAIDRLRPGYTGAETLAGLRMIWVTTTGARSGLPRRTPLLGVPAGDGLALIGTNFGQPAAPAWVHNLRVHPDAVAEYRGRSLNVRAREASPDERDRVLGDAPKIYDGYALYAQRITNRDVHVMVLEPVD